MEKKPYEIEHPRYFEPIGSNADRNLLVDTYLRRLVAIAKQEGWDIESDALLTKQKMEVDTHNARLIARKSKEKERDVNDKRKAISQCISKKKELRYATPDENNIMLEYGYHEKITFEKFNKLGESKFKITVKIGNIIDTLINDGALDDLPDVRTDTKAFEKAFYEKYNGKTVHLWYPNDGKSPMHLFPIKFVWRL